VRFEAFVAVSALPLRFPLNVPAVVPLSVNPEPSCVPVIAPGAIFSDVTEESGR